ncbi:MAG: DUF5752 family protein [Candidatus Omnitrophota bacterium]|jgi:septum formation topological specificity factor MinE
MSDLTQNAQPFKFYTRLHLSELTGLRASNLAQLLKLIKEVPGSCIYHHTHRFLQQHQYLSPEPPNDFAHWVNEVLGEASLGEKLASIDTIQFSTIRSLREEIIKTIESYIKNNPLTRLKFASEGEEFHFIKSVSFIVPTKYIAYNLSDFVEILKKITIDSIYFHIFEARLRLERTANDFSYWIETSIGDKTLASIIAHLDPYTYTLEDLRRAVVRVVEEYIRSKN